MEWSAEVEPWDQTDLTEYQEQFDRLVQEAVASFYAEDRRSPSLPNKDTEELLLEEIRELEERLHDEWEAGYRAGYHVGRIAERDCWPEALDDEEGDNQYLSVVTILADRVRELEEQVKQLASQGIECCTVCGEPMEDHYDPCYG